MLNLAIRNTKRASYPRIFNKDFFAIALNTKLDMHDFEGKKDRKLLPHFNAIIGNPPYTRQEDIGTMLGTVTKSKIQNMIKQECGFEPSQRTSIYAYFFYHASIFLKNEGYLAYIVQNSWLDTDYGTDLQQYMLRNYEIVAIMDSEVERFFPTASVNTSIVILRKQKDEDLRNNNTVRFIYFTEFLATALKAHKGSEGLRDYILKTRKNETNDNFRVNCVKQTELASHSKWSPFLKAPKVYFDILEKGKGKWKPLSVLADVIRGYMTGCNDFFIVKDITTKALDQQLHVAVNNFDNLRTLKSAEKDGLRLVQNGFGELWLIEEQFLKPMLTSPKDVDTYEFKPAKLTYSILLVHDEKKDLKKHSPYVFKYIQNAKKEHINHSSSLAARKLWYNVGQKNLPDMSFNYIINEYGRTFYCKAYTNNNFHNVYAEKNAKSIWLFLNSTISFLNQQLIMRSNLGDGAGKIETYELASFPMIDLNLQKLKVNLGATTNFKEELGSLTSLKTVNPERVKLDSAILDAIGYTKKSERDEVLLALYKATYQMIDARLKKAQSLKGVKSQRNKVSFDVYVDHLKQLLQDAKAQAKNTITFGKHVEKLTEEITSDNKLQKRILDTYWKEKFGEAYNEKKIAGKQQVKLF